ncbi:MAG: hypothetical protein LBV08_10000, partial [Clostridiales bacterium]|nr:hypothetical protein [Clostridiales bacterium]
MVVKNMVADPKIIQIKMFGSFDILYKGESIFNKGKHTNKIFEILKFMIINSEKEFSSEIICENIWPDIEYLDVRNTVTTYIFRLNKFLKEGNNVGVDVSDYLKIVCQKGSYKLTITDDCSIDIKQFNALYDEMEFENDEAKKIDIILESMKIYKGELLNDSSFDSWVTPFRNYYRRIFSEMNRTILSIYLERKEYKEILKLCKDIFEVSALDEYTNLYYLKALNELNYTNEAITHYEYISSRFISELGRQPSKDMKDIYNKMKNKRGSDEYSDMATGVSINQLFDENSDFWKVFSSAIDDYMDKNAETKSYSIGFTYIENTNDSEFKVALSAFMKAIQRVLRKE